MYPTEREIVETLRATPETLTQLLAGLSAEKARSARGGDEDWSVIEVVCHLRDTEEVMLQRTRSLRDEKGAQLAGFNQEALARERNYAGDNLQAALAAFIQWRTQHADELAALSLAAWENMGTHSSVGPVTLRNHALHIVWHDAIHLAQIARQIG